MSAPYPWLDEIWAQLLDIARSSRQSHALLINGRPGLGLDVMARQFAHLTLCETPLDGIAPCGKCRGCTLFTAGSHPDFRTVVPAETGKGIVIEQIRELSEYYTLKAHFPGAKIALIDPADALNRAASNAMLKTLEEPPAGALLILVSNNLSAIPMTIRSRCVRLTCPKVPSKVALDWLRDLTPELSDGERLRLFSQSGGAPLATLALARNLDLDAESTILNAIRRMTDDLTPGLVLAKECANLPVVDLVRGMQTVTNRLILAKFALQPHAEAVDTEVEPGLHDLTDHLNLKGLYAFLDLIFESKASLTRQSGVRDQDIAESLWLGLRDALDTK